MQIETAVFATFAHVVARGMEFVGIGVIVLGAAIASGIYIRRVVSARDRSSDDFHRYRGDLGRAILLGLEFLVAADIIGTVAVEPTFENLGILAVIVLIRTFLSFSLEVEINGHWPWRGTELSRGGPETDRL